MLDHDLSLTHSGSDSVPAFHEVCRSVLKPRQPVICGGECAVGGRPFVWRPASSDSQVSRYSSQARCSCGNSARPRGIVLRESLLLLFQSCPLKMKHVMLLGRLAHLGGWDSAF